MAGTLFAIALSPTKKDNLMKHPLLLAGLFFSVLFLSPKESQAQWQPDVRLTNNSSESYTSYNNAWCIASSGDSVHAVWWENGEIYYKRSTDGGASWGADTRLTKSASSIFPCVAVSDSVVHVVWYDQRDGNYEIYYKHSTDGGSIWGADTRLTNESASSLYPCVAVSDSVVHVVWYDVRNFYNEIYYQRSIDGGTSWGADIRLTIGPAQSYLPSVAVSDSVVHVVWEAAGDFNPGIYHMRSTDEGANWGIVTRLTNDTATSFFTSVGVSDSAVHVVWRDERDGNTEIYYKRSTDGGISWGADTRLTNNSADSWDPSVSVSGQAVHVAWWDFRDGNNEIYYKRSTDGGASWGADIRLTNNSAGSARPSVSASSAKVHVVWYDYRDGSAPEIYYKRDTTGTVTGIENIGSEFPEGFRLEQNYPNPFNPSSAVTFQIPHSSHVVLKVYDVLGREVATLVNEELKPGSYEVPFDASGLASGVYLYRLTAGYFSDVKKLLVLR